MRRLAVALDAEDAEAVFFEDLRASSGVIEMPYLSNAKAATINTIAIKITPVQSHELREVAAKHV